MNESRLSDYLEHIRQAATDACSFVEGQSKKDFLADRRTQQAVILSLLIIGEAATKLLQSYGDFLTGHPDVPWSSMKGMRNRLAAGIHAFGKPEHVLYDVKSLLGKTEADGRL